MIPIVPPKTDTTTEALYKQSRNNLKKLVENKMDAWASDKLRIGKIALIAGGVAFAGYILAELFFAKKKKTYPSNQLKPIKDKDPWIVKSIKGYILAFLLTIAKEKIITALEQLNTSDAANNKPSDTKA
jgi:hypothetical protein